MFDKIYKTLVVILLAVLSLVTWSGNQQNNKQFIAQSAYQPATQCCQCQCQCQATDAPGQQFLFGLASPTPTPTFTTTPGNSATQTARGGNGANTAQPTISVTHNPASTTTPISVTGTTVPATPVPSTSVPNTPVPTTQVQPTQIPPTSVPPVHPTKTHKPACNNGGGNGSEACSPSDKGNDDETGN